jgi:hypothetical protein
VRQLVVGSFSIEELHVERLHRAFRCIREK